MKAVFMGTPDFAVPSLEILIEMGVEVACVVTQPDKVKGRGKKLIYSPVKELAIEHDIPVLQPVRIRKDEEFKKEIRAIAPDVIIVVAFGQIIPQDVLDIPKMGCINVHGSLLPKYRGAAPVQWAIINGEKTTGVTTMLMDAGLDTGDMLLKAETEIGENETGGELSERLSVMGAELLKKTLKEFEAISPEKQNDDEAGQYASMLTKEMGELDFTKSAGELKQLMLGLNPWPGTYTYMGGKMLKIWEAELIGEDSDYLPGQVSQLTKKSFNLQTGAGQLKIKSLQLEGKKRMDTAAFLAGNKLEEGKQFGK